MKLIKQCVTLTTLAAVPALAQAHPGHAEVFGLTSGFGHPLAGADHLLAMVAVGLWGAQMGGRAQWMLPLSFVAFMLLGAGLGLTGVAMPAVEQGIVASVLVLGLMLMWAAKVPTAVGAALVASFAVMHGLAHGGEMPTASNVPAYMSGFVLSTAFLHIAGLGLGRGLRGSRLASVSRLLGAAIALFGLGLALS